MKIRATIERGGKTATGIEVPADVVDALGAGKRPAVTVTVNGHTYRSTVASMGGRFLLPVSAEVREAAGVAAGDVVDVEITLDTAPREVAVPDELRRALAADPQASAFFEGLSYSGKRRYTLAIEGAKTPETRQRRVDKAVADLRAGRR